jgi:hypothetical protein
MEGVTAMDNTEPHDLITVLLRLEGLKGMAHEVGRQSTDELHVKPIDGGRIGFFCKMLASLRSWLIVPGK